MNFTRSLKRIVYFLLGMGISGVKWFKHMLQLITPGVQDKEKLYEDLIGLNTDNERVLFVYDNIRKTPLFGKDPRGHGMTHNLTDLVVEWTRASPQRAAKFFCGSILVLALALAISVAPTVVWVPFATLVGLLTIWVAL